MLLQSTNSDKSTFEFIAGFHIGIPLTICRTRESSGWEFVRKELANIFSIDSAQFEVIATNYDPVIKFPLGLPLAVRFLDFSNVFDIKKYFQEEAISIDQYKIDNLIWICPSGVILIMGSISLKKDDLVSFSKFEQIVGNHYAELAYIFTKVAELIIAAYPNSMFSSSVCCESDLLKLRKAIDLRNAALPNIPKDLLHHEADILSYLLGDEAAFLLYEEILIDVYYIEFHPYPNHRTLLIGYADSSIKSYDSSYLLYFCIAYSTFVGLLWIIKHLGEQLKIVQQHLIAAVPLRESDAFELKLFRIFCMQFINESKPISIRLTREYMECIEEYWEKSRLYSLVNQVNDQIETLGKMFDWIEENRRESRNFKIALAAITLALLSIAAVSAQLISTIDVESQLGMMERTYLIFLGFITGILSTVCIYILPIAKWYAQLRDKKWYRKRLKK